MKQRVYIHYYNKQLASFRRHLRSTLKNGTVEDVHKLRVSIKKLKTQWSFMEAATHGQWKSRPCLELFGKLFRVAGKLRETQVNLHAIGPFGAAGLAPYSASLQRSQKYARKRLIGCIQDFDRKKFESLNRQLRCAVGAVSDEAVPGEAVSFAVKKTKKVLALSEQLPDIRKLHKIRIHQKAVLEILTMLRKLSPKLPVEPLQLQIKALNTQIGNWHDTSELTASVERCRARNAGRKDMQKLENFMTRLACHQEKQLREAGRLLNSDTFRQQLKQLENLPGA